MFGPIERVIVLVEMIPTAVARHVLNLLLVHFKNLFFHRVLVIKTLAQSLRLALVTSLVVEIGLRID